MSIFKDDISLHDSLQRIQVNAFQAKTVKENPKHEINSSKNEEFEKVVLSDRIQRRQKYDNTLESMQEEINLVETTKQGLHSIQSQLQEMKSQVEKTLEKPLTEENMEEVNKTVKDGLENIQNIVENTSLNEIKPLKESSFDNNKNNEDNNIIKEKALKTEEDLRVFLQKVENKTNETVETQKQIVKYEEKIIQRVDSLVELPSNLDPNKSMRENIEIGKELKETAINGIIKDPETGKKIQIKALDDNILLALFSVSRVK
ncbi:MAG: hypothetical protein ACD_20C00435G0012 [uncultured bacterium]|nr:MAG: hypothetical protein ACD_20C00435G0012 [uncultured bacterium]